MTTYSYTVTLPFNAGVLYVNIINSVIITTQIQSINLEDTSLDITFVSALSIGEETELDNLVANNNTLIDMISSFGEMTFIYVIAATTSNGSLANDFENGDIIDGYTLRKNDVILLKNQTDGIENGIYRVNITGSPDRYILETDMNVRNCFIFVKDGSQSDTIWISNNDVYDDIVGQSDLQFILYTGVTGPTGPNGNTGPTGSSENIYNSDGSLTSVRTLNMVGQELTFTDGSNRSIDFLTRAGYNQLDELVLDWRNQVLFRTDGSDSVRWNDSILPDPSSIMSVAWSDRILYDGTPVQSISWVSRTLTNSIAFDTVNWELNNLIGTNGTSVDWENGILTDTNVSGLTSVNWSDRNLIDSGSNVSVDWENRQLLNGSPGSALDWNTRLHSDQVPEFADNTAALTGGLIVGDIYYTNVSGDGILKIVI